MPKPASILGGLMFVALGATAAFSADIPVDDRDLFSHLFTQKSIPGDWIFEAANEELTPAIMAGIAKRLTTSGGTYKSASKNAKGWDLDFQNGTARARIVRSASDHKLIGVFFSKLE